MIAKMIKQKDGFFIPFTNALSGIKGDVVEVEIKLLNSNDEHKKHKEEIAAAVTQNYEEKRERDIKLEIDDKLLNKFIVKNGLKG